MNFFQQVSESNNSTSSILPWLILWIISTRVYVNLIINLSDIDAKITFISTTMTNVKGITQSPKMKTEIFKLVETLRGSDVFSRTYIHYGASPSTTFTIKLGSATLLTPPTILGGWAKFDHPKHFKTEGEKERRMKGWGRMQRWSRKNERGWRTKRLRVTC